MVDPEFLARHVDFVLDDATIPDLPNHYRGKVRDNYDLPDGRRIIIATDRLSAFDRAVAAIPFKGQVLTQTARFWFEATADLWPNHVLDYPDPNVVLCTRLDILPVEIVVRDYLAGTTATSVWSMYRQGRREMYGVRFPDGLRENEKLARPVMTPTTKARDGDHDEPVTPIPLEVIAATAGVNIGAFETITGATFAPADPETPPLARIRANLRRRL
jgi:phosphoribosylaminoimidazole-succinocarboxamide synthase